MWDYESARQIIYLNTPNTVPLNFVESMDGFEFGVVSFSEHVLLLVFCNFRVRVLKLNVYSTIGAYDTYVAGCNTVL